jgi:hypothetical protein
MQSAKAPLHGVEILPRVLAKGFAGGCPFGPTPAIRRVFFLEPFEHRAVFANGILAAFMKRLPCLLHPRNLRNLEAVVGFIALDLLRGLLPRALARKARAALARLAVDERSPGVGSGSATLPAWAGLFIRLRKIVHYYIR